MREVLFENRQETSQLISVVRADGSREPAFMRALTGTLYSMYLFAILVCSLMSFQTFLAVVRLHFPEVRYKRKKIDYCDHCHLWRVNIVAEFWKYEDQARGRLEAISQHISNI